MTKPEILKICKEEMLLYKRAPDKLNDEQKKYLDFFESVMEMIGKEDEGK